MNTKVVLPRERSGVENYNPRLMVIGGRPKSGKSSFAAAIESNLIIDLEDGYRSLRVMKLEARTAVDLWEIRRAIEEDWRSTGEYPYRCITIDNATSLEAMSLQYAAALYRKTPMGQMWGYKSDKYGKPLMQDGKYVIDESSDIRTLPNGSGYLYLRRALKEMIGWFRPLCETLILITHIKDKTIRWDNQEMSEMSIDLAGKSADIICGESDAVGLIYREGRKTWLSFEGGGDFIREARPLHLRGRKFLIAESKEGEDELHFNLDGIFI